MQILAADTSVVITNQVVPCELIKLYLVDERANEIVCQDGSDLRIPLGEGIAGHVALTGKIVNVPGKTGHVQYFG